MVFTESFFGGPDKGVDAVPFVFGVVEVELFGAERAFEGDLVGREWLGVGASKGDHGKRESSIFAFCSP